MKLYSIFLLLGLLVLGAGVICMILKMPVSSAQASSPPSPQCMNLSSKNSSMTNENIFTSNAPILKDYTTEATAIFFSTSLKTPKTSMASSVPATKEQQTTPLPLQTKREHEAETQVTAAVSPFVTTLNTIASEATSNLKYKDALTPTSFYVKEIRAPGQIIAPKISQPTVKIRTHVSMHNVCRIMSKKFDICLSNPRTRRYARKCASYKKLRQRRACLLCRKNGQCGNLPRGFSRK